MTLPTRGANWLCFARWPPGNADLPIGTVARIGFVLRDHGSGQIWHNSFPVNSLASVCARRELALFRTTGAGTRCVSPPGELALFCTIGPSDDPARPAGKLALFRTLAPWERRSPDRHSGKDWLCFAEPMKRSDTA